MPEQGSKGVVTFLGGFVSGFFFLLVLLGVVILTNPGFFGHRTTEVQVGGLYDGEAFPPHFAAAVYDTVRNWKLTSLGGEEVEFASFRGKPTFLHFWGTYCAPCIPELKSIQSLYDSLKKDNIQFVMVANQQPDIVKRFLKGTAYVLPFYTTDPGIPSDVSGGGFPSTFIITSQGTIVSRHSGVAEWDQAWVRNYLRGIK